MTAKVVKLVRPTPDIDSIRNMVFPRRSDIKVGATLVNEGVIDEGGEFVITQITSAQAKPGGGYRIIKVDTCRSTNDIIYMERTNESDDRRVRTQRRMRFAQLRYSSIWWLKP